MADGSSPMCSFDLLTQPWIPVRMIGGEDIDFSLRDVFSRADEIADIAGEIPTQTFAIVRLLLAILYRAHGEPLTTDVWESWYREGLPMEDINDYFDDFSDCFNLLHPDRPFFQVANLATAKGEYKSVGALIFDLPGDGRRLFTTRAGEFSETLSFAEAARWLVNLQAYDASGIKSGALDDERVKGGKGYPIGVGWSGHLGGVLAMGQNLRETLLLNLVVPSAVSLTQDILQDVPVWERRDDPDTGAERGVPPAGPVMLYTWQSRRVRLCAEGGRVTGCIVANGDKLTPQNQYRNEPLTAWRFSEPQTKKAGGSATYMPLKHQTGRSFWRGLSALLPLQAALDAKSGAPTRLRPALTEWLAFIGRDTTVRLRAIGVEYGTQDAVVDEVFDDSVTLSSYLLRSEGGTLAHEVDAAIRAADNGVAALGTLAANIALAAGSSDTDGARRRARERAWAVLDLSFRTWLQSLSSSSEPALAGQVWREQTVGVLRNLAREMEASAGPAAWAGRMVRDRQREGLMTVSLAMGRFDADLARVLGSARKTGEASE